MPKKYTLTLTDKQLGVVYDALEWFFRLQMGQFFDFATEVAKAGYVYDKTDPENSKKFDAYIERRNTSQKMFQSAFRVAQPVTATSTKDMRIAQDIWQDIRYQLWLEKPEPKTHGLVNSDPPLYVSTEPPISIEKDDIAPQYPAIVEGLRREAENTRANYLYSLLHHAANAIETLSKATEKRKKRIPTAGKSIKGEVQEGK